MGTAARRRMHPITMQWKRAHLMSVAFGTKVLHKVKGPGGCVGMTPAAFDLMYAVATAFGDPAHTGKEPHTTGYPQSDLCTFLGLHPSTVSKLVKRLRRLGWVTNVERNEQDHRFKYVRLTPTGMRRIQWAMRIVFQQRTHLKFFEGFFKAQRNRKRNVLQMIHEYWSTLRSLGQALGDGSLVLYRPDYRKDARWRVPPYLEAFRQERAQLSGPAQTGLARAGLCETYAPNTVAARRLCGAHAPNMVAACGTPPRRVDWTRPRQPAPKPNACGHYNTSRRSRAYCTTVYPTKNQRPTDKAFVDLIKYCGLSPRHATMWARRRKEQRYTACHAYNSPGAFDADDQAQVAFEATVWGWHRVRWHELHRSRHVRGLGRERATESGLDADGNPWTAMVSVQARLVGSLETVERAAWRSLQAAPATYPRSVRPSLDVIVDARGHDGIAAAAILGATPKQWNAMTEGLAFPRRIVRPHPWARP